MFCGNCGNETSETQKFCPICGAKNVRYKVQKEENLEEIVRKAVEGDSKAQAKIYTLTYKQAYAVAIQIVKNEQDAMDILQESYISAFINLENIKNPEKLKSWFNCIVANRCRDWLKKKKPALFTDMNPDDEAGDYEDYLENKDETFSPEESVDYAETKRLMKEILERLPEDQKLCVLMFYYEELSVAEIAEALGCSEGTVKSRLNYARKKIKSDVEELERKGTKLYSIAPLPFILWMLRAGEDAISMPAEFSAQVGAEVKAAAKLAKAESELGNKIAKAEPELGNKMVKGAVKETAKASAKKTIAVKVATGIVCAGVLGGGAAFGYKQLADKPVDENKVVSQEKEDTKKDESEKDNMKKDEPEKEEKLIPPLTLTEEEITEIQGYISWFDTEQKYTDGFSTRKDYTMELSNNKIPSEVLDYVASAIVVTDDTMGTDAGEGEFLQIQETLSNEEWKTFLQDSFGYEVQDDSELGDVFETSSDGSYMAVWGYPGDEDTKYEIGKIAQTGENEYHFYVDVKPAGMGDYTYNGVGDIPDPYELAGTMDVTAHKNEKSKLDGWVFDKIEFTTTDRKYATVTFDVGVALEGMLQIKAESETEISGSDLFIPSGMYSIEEYSEKEMKEYADFFMSFALCIDSERTLLSPDMGNLGGCEMSLESYEDIYVNTMGGNPEDDYIANSEVTQDKIKFNGARSVSWFRVKNVKIIENYNGTVAITGEMLDLEAFETCEYPFTAAGHVSEKSKMGFVIDQIDFGDNSELVWKRAYIEFVKRRELDGRTFELIDINGDEIPELVSLGNCMADNTLIATFGNGAVQTREILRSSLLYIDGKNLVNNDGGSMGEYYDQIYKIEDGIWEQVVDGKYWDDIDYDEESGRYICDHYMWNGEEVDREEYNQKLYDLADWNSAMRVSETGVSAEEIISQINNY